MLRQDRGDMTTNDTDGGKGGRSKDGNKMIQKEAKTGDVGGSSIICNASNRV